MIDRSANAAVHVQPATPANGAWQATLTACSHVAKEELARVDQACKQAGMVHAYLTRTVGQAVARLPQRDTGLTNAGGGRRFDNEALAALQRQLADLHRERDGWARSLDRFTVMLFGRTLAGKSTIREALTNGDGSTIGTGAQRTTRDVREHEWHALRIVDTPGIAAYQGQADRDLTVSMVDRADLVLFLLSSDGIQEEVFEGLRMLREQAKPVIFILNMKHDLEAPVMLRRALKNPALVFDCATLEGHYHRIRALARDKLAMPEVRIVPLHAQAAFLATRPEHVANAAALHRLSRVDELLHVLRREVEIHGRLRRVQTITGGTAGQLLAMQGQAVQWAKKAAAQVQALGRQSAELDGWRQHFMQQAREQIAGAAAQHLRGLRGRLSAFVDENIERADFGERWQRQVQALDADGWLAEQQQRIRDHVREELADAVADLNTAERLAGHMSGRVPETCDPLDVRRGLRWGSAVAGGAASLAAAAAWIGGTNFWNPVGWVAGAVSVVAFGLSCLFGGRDKQLQKRKAETASDLRAQLQELEHAMAASLFDWLDREVGASLERAIVAEPRALGAALRQIGHALRQAAGWFAAQVGELDRWLLVRAGDVAGHPVALAHVERAVRDPGLCIKFLWRGKADPAFCAAVARALGEHVDGVPEVTRTRQVASALRPAIVAASDVVLDGERAMVRLAANQVGKAKGRHGSNVSLASRLLGFNIHILSEHAPRRAA